MGNKNACVGGSVLMWGGILLLLAFDVLPISDNRVIYIALACLIIGVIIKKGKKVTSSCCK